MKTPSKPVSSPPNPSPATLSQTGAKDAPNQAVAPKEGGLGHTPTPWVVDNGTVDMVDQGDMLISDSGTSRQWVAIGINDDEGFAEVVALAHPTNAPFIAKACNCHDELLAACKAVMAMIDSAQLVRDTSHDAEGGWAIKSLKLVRDIKLMHDAIEKASKP